MKSRAPEPTQDDINRASRATALEVFEGSDGALTVAYYRRLQGLGPAGKVAMNLFRAQKTSSRAKHYRGRQYRHASYDVKNYSLQQLCAELVNYNGTAIFLAEPSPLAWGWKRDPHTPGFEWVLYVVLPTGQVSFHSAVRGTGPEFSGDWDQSGASRDRILAWCDQLLQERSNVHKQVESVPLPLA